jgi:hypothetical protein
MSRTGGLESAAFCAVGVLAAVFGLGVLVRRSWAAVGLLVLSSVDTGYFFGTAVLAVLWPWLPWSMVKTPGIPMVSNTASHDGAAARMV